MSLQYVATEAFLMVWGLPSLKMPFYIRKLGNKLVIMLAEAHKEEMLDKEPMILKLILSMNCDMNWKIR